MRRIYIDLLQHHLANYRQMLFLAGPRQAGKTTLSKTCLNDDYHHYYLNWDNIKDREIILSGIESIYSDFTPDVLDDTKKIPVIIFDEIHKYTNWKNLLKGYFDSLDKRAKIIVTGSAKLDVYRRGGDSMMGRYFLYRIYPISVAEIAGRRNFTQDIIKPKPINTDQWQNLLHFGGFPEPYLQASESFYRRWTTLKHDQLFKEDLRDVSNIYNLSQVELLAELLSHQIGSLTKYSELSKKIQASEPTVKYWIELLSNLYYSFSIKPWSKNIARSLLKNPKVYLWNWSAIADPGARLENLVACHLKKAAAFWTDAGIAQYELFYLRDKEGREVDFLMTKDGKPWLMVEVKSSSKQRLSEQLEHFNHSLQAPHVVQVAADLPFIEQDCFAIDRPMIVPLQTFLSQLA